MKQLNVKYIIKRERWVINASRIGNSDKLGSYITEAEARKAADELLAKFTLGMIVKKEMPDISVKAAMDQFMSLQWRRVDIGKVEKDYVKETKTNLRIVSGYKISGKPFEKHILKTLVQPINQDMLLMGFEEGIEGDAKSKHTAEKRIKYLKSFLNFCTKKRYIDCNPLDKFTYGKSFDLSKKTKIIIEEAVIKLIVEKGLSVITLQEKTMVIMALTSGIRQGELRAIKWHDVNFDTKKIYVQSAVKHNTSIIGTTKTNKGIRTIPIDERSMNTLKEWKLQSKFSQANDLVFPNGVGNILGKKIFTPICKKICDAAGTVQLTWGDFRHTFASNQLSGLGEDWAEVARLMGHSTPSFTYGQYGHYVDNDVKNDKARNASSAAMYG